MGTRLFPHYGSREMGLGGAVTCPAHEGMHLRENHVIAEIIDAEGRPLPWGEYGELVITTIGMEAMPLIRYRTGDYTRILPEPCPCGSRTIRLDALRRKGVNADILKLDEEIFDLPFAVDYKAELSGDILSIEALCLGGSVEALEAAALRAMPEKKIKITMRPAAKDDRPMVLGKRRLEIH